ncbi:RusA family crossover junction endodeoxyribonuclease [Rhodanobacter sp. FW106-PBR-LB-2-11]|uniref:RusA family crossover junction endodeoxyribonuclease n=1 Tax=Rhodanobacter sp. FW106-PBR-LB-2-11 TaxID=1524463 RepID=UPI0034E37E0D
MTNLSRQAWANYLGAPNVAPQAHRAAVSGAKAAARTGRSTRRPAGRPGIAASVTATQASDAAIPAVQVFDVDPVPKPRMTQRDKWGKRPCVLRYRAYGDELRLRGLRMPHRYSLIFIVAMPATWSAREKEAANGLPNLRRPDATNLAKAVEDIALQKDEALWDGRSRKYWGYRGRVVVLKREVDLLSSVDDDAQCPEAYLPAAG